MHGRGERHVGRGLAGIALAASLPLATSNKWPTHATLRLPGGTYACAHRTRSVQPDAAGGRGVGQGFEGQEDAVGELALRRHVRVGVPVAHHHPPPLPRGPQPAKLGHLQAQRRSGARVHNQQEEQQQAGPGAAAAAAGRPCA